jgi:hypothetical protein
MNDVVTANPFDTGSAPAPTSGALIAIEQSKAVAEVQAALLYARANPRDPRTAMDRILQDCMRPGLAEAATYQYARGGNDISGPSIRLAETLAKRWGNMEAGVKELSRRDGVSECLAYAWDYETNYRDVRTFTVRHWRDTKQGGYALKDERDVYEMIANYGARRKRACILALIDGDVIEAAVKQCELTQATKVQVTDELIAGMLERFLEFGISKEMIERRIQRHMSALTPALALSLKRIYNSLRDGMSAPAEWFDMPGGDAGANVTEPTGGSRTAAVKSRIRTGAKARGGKDAKDKADEPRATPVAQDQPAAHTYAQVLDLLTSASDIDTLNLAADLIRTVANAEQRRELEEQYSLLAARFDDPGESA